MPTDFRQFITKPKEVAKQTADETSLEDNFGEILHRWQAPEFEVYEKSKRWYVLAGLFLLSIIVYAMLTNGPIMAITFILVGILGYVHLQQDPRTVDFAITTEGIVADKDIYLYENIQSFWIFYEPDQQELISLHTKASVLPFIHIPLGDEDPVHIRELLLANIPEIKQEPSLIDNIEKLLHI